MQRICTTVLNCHSLNRLGDRKAGQGVPTDQLGVPTDQPGVPTDGPRVPMDGPVVPTDGPVVPTDGPVVPTDGLGVPTDGPGVPTDGLAVPTNGLAVPTEAVFVVSVAMMTMARGSVSVDSVGLTPVGGNVFVVSAERRTATAGRPLTRHRRPRQLSPRSLGSQ